MNFFSPITSTLVLYRSIFLGSCDLVDSTENATILESTKSIISNSLVKIQIQPKSQCEFVPRDREIWVSGFGLWGCRIFSWNCHTLSIFSRNFENQMNQMNLDTVSIFESNEKWIKRTLIQCQFFSSCHLIQYQFFYTFMFFFKHAHMHVYTCVCMYVCMYVRLFVSMHVCTYACMSVCTLEWMNTCMYVRVYIFTYIYTYKYT